MIDIPPAHDIKLNDFVLTRAELSKLCSLRDFLNGMTYKSADGRITGHHELTMLIRMLCDFPEAK